MNVHLYYPDTAEFYNPAVAEAGKRFTWLLFEPDRLPEVTHPAFQERLQGRGVTLNGLPALQAYRRWFGEPVLRRVNMYAVPPSRARHQLDTNGNYVTTGKRFTFDTMFELIFGIRAEDLAPELQGLFPPDTLVPVTLRMREPYIIREIGDGDAPVPGATPGQLFVFGRSYWPIIEGRVGGPGDQHDFVRRQVQYFAEHGTPMAADPKLIVPLWEIYNRITLDHFETDPRVR